MHHLKVSKKFLCKSAVAALFGGAMLVGAGVALAAKPVAGGGTAYGACSTFDGGSLFFEACMANQAVAAGNVSTEGLKDAAYLGSCEGGGACADSVYNKLTAAASKYEVPKLDDACQKLADIQSDLTTWSTAAKPKINTSGAMELSTKVRTIQTYGGCP